MDVIVPGDMTEESKNVNKSDFKSVTFFQKKCS